MRRRAPRSWSGRHAIVTGGSEGIGLAVARKLVAAGCGVTLVARRAERLEEVAAELRGGGGGAAVRTLALDIGEEVAVALKVPAELEEQPADVLINCAGIANPGLFLDADAADLRAQMDVNYFGAVWMTRAVLPHLLARGDGHVVIVGSTAGLIGVYGYTGYTPPKAALYGLAEVLRAELMNTKIGVTVVLPGTTRTKMLEHELEVAPEITKKIIMSAQIQEADEVAEALLDGVARGRFEVIPGLQGRASLRAYRALPGIGRAFLDWEMRRAGG